MNWANVTSFVGSATRGRECKNALESCVGQPVRVTLELHCVGRRSTAHAVNRKVTILPQGSLAAAGAFSRAERIQPTWSVHTTPKRPFDDEVNVRLGQIALCDLTWCDWAHAGELACAGDCGYLHYPDHDSLPPV